MDEKTLNEKYNHELYHYGIPGQKWYVRRYQNKDGSLTPAGRKRQAKLKSELDMLDGTKSVQESPKSRLAAYREKKQAEKEKAEKAARLEKARQAKLEKQKAAAERAEKLKNGELSVEEMTDQEIQDKLNRIALEDNLKKAMKQTSDKEIQDKIDRLELEDSLRKTVKDYEYNFSSEKKQRAKDFTDKFKDDVVEKLAKNVASDLVAQTVKAILVEGTNKVLNNAINKGATDKDGNLIKKEYVFTNNKRKDK